MSQPIRATVTLNPSIQASVALNPSIQAKVVALGKPASLAELSDIDMSQATDGALLIYNGTRHKFVATTVANNPNTIVSGGYF